MAAFQDTFYRCFIEDNRWRYLTRGLGNTLLITFFALLIGVALGVVAAIYLVMVVFFTWLVGRLERRLRNSER